MFFRVLFVNILVTLASLVFSALLLGLMWTVGLDLTLLRLLEWTFATSVFASIGATVVGASDAQIQRENKAFMLILFTLFYLAWLTVVFFRLHAYIGSPIF